MAVAEVLILVIITVTAIFSTAIVMIVTGKSSQTLKMVGVNTITSSTTLPQWAPVGVIHTGRN